MKKNMNMKIRIIVLAVLIAILLLATSCVKDEINVGPAIIENVITTPKSPLPSDSVKISAKVTDLKGVTSVKVYYRIVGAKDFTQIAMKSGEKYSYSAALPPFPKDTKIEYYLEALNASNLTTLFPAAAPATLSNFNIGAPIVLKVYVNECDPFAKKLELYNSMNFEVDLSGWTICKDNKLTDPTSNWTIPAGTKMPALGYLVFTQDINGVTGFTFGMSATKGFSYELFDKSSVSIDKLDNLTTIIVVPATPNTVGRKTDGASQIVLFSVGSFGASNATGTLAP